MSEWSIVCIWAPGYRQRWSLEEVVCLNSLVGTLIQSPVGMLNPFRNRVRWRIVKRWQGNVGLGVLWLVPVGYRNA